MENPFNQKDYKFSHETSELLESLSVEELKTIIQKKNEMINIFTKTLNQLKQDFNYNVELIYERDSEIEILNARIDELLILTQQKDLEIQSLLQYCSRVKQLESDKQILSNRLQAIVSSRNSNKQEFFKAYTPSPYKYNNYESYKSSPNAKNESNQKRLRKNENFQIDNLLKLNSELENRIKNLQSDSAINTSFDKSSMDISLDDIDKMKEKVHQKEIEISTLITSINPLKVNPKKKNFSEGDIDLKIINEDIERLKKDLHFPS